MIRLSSFEVSQDPLCQTKNRKSFSSKKFIEFSITDLSQILSKIADHPELVDLIGKWEKLSEEPRRAEVKQAELAKHSRRGRNRRHFDCGL